MPLLAIAIKLSQAARTGRWGDTMYANYESLQMRASHLTGIFRSKFAEYEKLYPNDKLFDNIYTTEK